MPCTCPVDMWPPRPGSEDKRWVHSPFKSYSGAVAIKRPCGQCNSCRLSKAREVGRRCVDEARYYDQTCFLTNTYSDEHLPSDLSVDTRTHTLFMKRLRSATGVKVRFLMAAEYGERGTLRPHYHYLLFGWSPPDCQLYSTTAAGSALYTSEMLDRIWGLGAVKVGELTQKSAQYVAQYTLKKVNGKLAESEYTREYIDVSTGELRTRKVRPVFSRRSLKPGLGFAYAHEFQSDFYPSDFLITDGKKVPVPQYYVHQLTEAQQEAVRQKRKAEGRLRADDNTEARLLTRHESAQIKADRFKRDLEDG